jgi:hypothetical protein
MGGICIMHMEMRNAYKVVVGKLDFGVDGKLIPSPRRYSSG